jgi:predicted dehydrogenase
VKDAAGWWVPSPDRPMLPYGATHTTLDLWHMADCVLDGVKPVNTPDHARHVIEVIQKGYESARTGQAFALETEPF